MKRLWHKWQSLSRTESGVVLVLFTLMVTTLLALAGLAIDVGLWYVEAQSVQKTADMAALSGAVHLPADPAGATSTAKDVAAKNGYTDGDVANGNVHVTAIPVTGKPYDLRATVTKTFRSVFASLVGLDSISITRAATAEYEQPVDMGSPANVFANEPLAPNDPPQHWLNVAFQPNMWGNVFGYQWPKANGDAIQAGQCTTEDGCTSGTNTDYSNAGYFYKIAVDQTQRPPGSRLAVEVFDPAAVYVGDHCDQNGMTDPTLASVVNPWITRNGGLPTDAAVRYAWGDTSNRAGALGASAAQFCTGDNTSNGLNMPVTSYVVRADTSPSDPTANPVVPQGTCGGLQFPGWTSNLASGVLDSRSANYDARLASVFRQWVPVCVFDPSLSSAPDYLLQIRTNVALGGDPSGPGSPQATGGSNRFAIRVAWVSSAVPFNLGIFNALPVLSATSGITVAGLGTMGLYANAAAGAGAPAFYLARVLPGGGNQTLRIRLFDIGDCGGCSSPPTLTFLRPDKTPWPICQARIGDNSTVVTPHTSCQLPAQANGQWITVDIPIPATYTCVAQAATDCWTTMTYQLPGAVGAALNDTTTWTAQILGNPVRLVS